MNKKAYVYKMNLVPANVLSIVIFIITLFPTFFFRINLYDTGVNTFILFILLLLYLWFHEVLHGIGYIIGGTKRKNVKYGICLEKGILYCMAYQELTKKNILISLQMPFMVIGVITYIIGIIFNLPLLVLLSSVNISGASMDLVMFYYIAKLPKDTIYSESGKNDEFVLISSEDLTIRKSIFLKIVDVKDYRVEDYIFDKISKFEITKKSIVIIVLFLLLGLVTSIL